MIYLRNNIDEYNGKDCAGPCIGSQRKSIDLRLGIETKGHRRGYFIHLPGRDRTKEVRLLQYICVYYTVMFVLVRFLVLSLGGSRSIYRFLPDESGSVYKMIYLESKEISSARKH